MIPRPYSLNTGPYIDDLAPEESFRLMKSWLDTCVFHPPACCTLPVIARLPTRVIDIGLRRGLQEPTQSDVYALLRYATNEMRQGKKS